MFQLSTLNQPWNLQSDGSLVRFLTRKQNQTPNLWVFLPKKSYINLENHSSLKENLSFSKGSIYVKIKKSAVLQHVLLTPLQGTNISPLKGSWVPMIFLFHRWDISVPSTGPPQDHQGFPLPGHHTREGGLDHGFASWDRLLEFLFHNLPYQTTWHVWNPVNNGRSTISTG